jgi:hypothetical protein
MKVLILAAVMTFAGTAWAQATPVGLWKTIDDKTKTERALVRITEAGGVLSGRVEKVLGSSLAGALVLFAARTLRAKSYGMRTYAPPYIGRS